MKQIDLPDDAYAALERLASARQLSASDLIASLVKAHTPATGDTLTQFLASEGYTQLADPIERYLTLLAWCARRHPTDFADFISHQDSGRRYLTWTRDEINVARTHNHARQIDGTQYWAVMTIDAATRRRFIARALEFIGCDDAAVARACESLGPVPAPRFALLSA